MKRQDRAGKFDAHYYADCCGAPYERGGVIWDFFSKVADAIVTGIAPRTVLDVGCAKGFLVELLRKRGVEAFGFDISEFAISQIAPEIRPYCTVSSVTEPLNRDYDLVVRQEILEHVSLQEADLAIANICEHTFNILFSSSFSDFSEPTHINVHSTEFWIGKFAEQGFFYDFDFDASFISDWAILFRKIEKPSLSVVEKQQHRLWHLTQETKSLREIISSQRTQLASRQSLIQNTYKILRTLQNALSGRLTRRFQKRRI
jgi:SAM-dependent methyltransferase